VLLVLFLLVICLVILMSNSIKRFKAVLSHYFSTLISVSLYVFSALNRLFGVFNVILVEYIKDQRFLRC